MNEDPVKRCALLILLQAQKDCATRLDIGGAKNLSAAVRYQVGGIWHDWHSPGTHMLPAIIAELGRLAGFGKRPFPREGLIDAKFSNARLLWVIRMANEGECVLTPVDQ